MGGRTTLPGGAFYHASKHAVEALSDALRLEVRPFGIDVVLIEPGPVKTAWNDVAASSVASAPVAPQGDEADDPYLAFKVAVAGGFGHVTDGPLARLSSDADAIAKVMTKAATTKRPRTRYLINPIARSTVAAKAVLPDRVHDLLLRKQYGLG
jgi:short-subunit dehydrogenase